MDLSLHLQRSSYGEDSREGNKNKSESKELHREHFLPRGFFHLALARIYGLSESKTGDRE